MSELKKKCISEDLERLGVILIALSFIFFYLIGFIFAANPVGPDDLESVSNSSKGAVGAKVWDIAGGNISVFNLTATIQNTRWKGFVGNLTGSFTLDDATGSTLFDWTLSSITGRIYTTRNSSDVNWSGVTCSNFTYLEQENTWLSHNSTSDNISATFNVNLSNVDHDPFDVGPVSISADSCPTLSTYVNNQSQAQGADVFEEIALRDNLNKTIYVTILESDVAGYNGNTYDFQMIVPENGSASWESSIPYYIYVELG